MSSIRVSKGLPDAEGKEVSKEFEQLVRREIVDVVDHKNFNLDVPFMKGVIPTSENIITAFWKILLPKVKPGKLTRLVLWETENNYVEYTGG